MERLRDLVAQGDRAVSDLEERVDAVLAADASDADRAAFLADLRGATDAVWATAARYLEVVDGLETASPEEVVRTAGHTGLLGTDEVEQAKRLLADQADDRLQGEALRRTPRHVRFLRLWLERVRDTAAKARD